MGVNEATFWQRVINVKLIASKQAACYLACKISQEVLGSILGQAPSIDLTLTFRLRGRKKCREHLLSGLSGFFRSVLLLRRKNALSSRSAMYVHIWRLMTTLPRLRRSRGFARNGRSGRVTNSFGMTISAGHPPA